MIGQAFYRPATGTDDGFFPCNYQSISFHSMLSGCKENFKKYNKNASEIHCLPNL